LIRGAIAFGLIARVTQKELLVDGIKESLLYSEVVQSCTLALVVLTTVVFGSLTNLVQKCLLSEPKN